MTLTFDSFQSDWWPYLFILLAGTLATEIWRWLGVFVGGALGEGSEGLVFVKAVATALVASVVGQLIVFPTGELAATPLMLRIAAAALGWLAFWFSRKSVLVGVLAAEAILLGGWLLTGE
ncbi:MAG: AzlD domain-containing protein [Pseudomonadota bacterium]|nr:AzlD domain-containing protein [Pseudomonadota bacterium]